MYSDWQPDFTYQCDGESQIVILDTIESNPFAFQCAMEDLATLHCIIPPGVPGLPIAANKALTFACIGPNRNQIAATISASSVSWICPALSSVSQNVFLGSVTAESLDYSQAFCQLGMLSTSDSDVKACRAQDGCSLEGACNIFAGAVAVTSRAIDPLDSDNYCPFCFENATVASTSSGDCQNRPTNIAQSWEYSGTVTVAAYPRPIMCTAMDARLHRCVGWILSVLFVPTGEFRLCLMS